MNHIDEKPMRMTMFCEKKKNEITTLDQSLKEVKGVCQQLKEQKLKIASKKLIATSVLAFFGSLSWAQTTSVTNNFLNDPFNHPLFPLYLISFLVLITIVLVLVTAAYTLRILNLFIQKAAEEKAEKLGITLVKQASWWDKTWQKWNALRPLEEEKNIELDHDYDGIRELDNHLPPWWKLLFYATIVWSLGYLIVYHVFNSLPLSTDEYQNELTQAAEDAKVFLASQPAAVIDENTLVYTKDDAILAKGKGVFISSCVPCHRNDGGGNTIGPNLTDQYWIHGGEIKNIYVTIKNGVIEKGMPMWGKAMSPQDVKAVSFYVMSLQGSNPANAKAPQGILFTPAEKTNAIDSVGVKSDSSKVQAMK
jgi:cytochrome c oxidase cbb3-type subunit 3